MKRSLLVALLLAMVLSVRGSGKQRDIVLTTDCGTEIDDQWAVVYLAVSPQFNLKGVVTTHAPNLAEPRSGTSANCVHDVFRRLHLASPPQVFAGSSVPLPERAPLRNAGIDFIIKTSREYSAKNRLTILTIGATTDVASAFLADPTLGDRVEVLTMGFNSWPRGTDPWNIKNDPLAYSVILDSRAPITIGGADVCRAHLTVDAKRVNSLVRGHGEVGDWLADLFEDFVTKNADFVAQDVGPQRWVIWDTIVVAHLLGYTQFSTHPRPALNTVDLTFLPIETDKTIRWITKVDETHMWEDFTTKIDKHNANLPKRY